MAVAEVIDTATGEIRALTLQDFGGGSGGSGGNGNGGSGGSTADDASFVAISINEEAVSPTNPLPVELKQNTASAPYFVEVLGIPAVARQLAAGTTSANTVLTATCKRISIKARTASIRYSIGTVAQTAIAASSHFIEVGERLDLAVPAGANIAVIRDTAATANAVLEVSELV